MIDNIQLDVVSFVRLETQVYNKLNYQVIKLTYSRFPERGFLRYVFSILLFDFGYHIMSDGIHTIPGSMNFWKKIKNLENAECRITNIFTKYNRIYKNQLDYTIWGVDEEYFVDGKINSLLVEDSWARRSINLELYNYILVNQKNIRDKEGLRLSIKVQNHSS